MNNNGRSSGNLETLKEAQSYLSLVYLVMVGIGMLFEYHRYRVYGINIFQFADVFDFLIAPFRDTVIFLFIICSLLLVVILYKWDQYLQRDKPQLYIKLSLGWVQKPWFKFVHQFLFALLFVFYLYLASAGMAKHNKSTIMHASHTIGLRLNDNQLLNAQLIGKTKDMVIIYKNSQVFILPLSRVNEFMPVMKVN